MRVTCLIVDDSPDFLTVATRMLERDGIDVVGVASTGSAALARAFGWVGSKLQTGTAGTYAWVLVMGVIAVLGAVTLR